MIHVWVIVRNSYKITFFPISCVLDSINNLDWKGIGPRWVGKWCLKFWWDKVTVVPMPLGEAVHKKLRWWRDGMTTSFCCIFSASKSASLITFVLWGKMCACFGSPLQLTRHGFLCFLVLEGVTRQFFFGWTMDGPSFGHSSKTVLKGFFQVRCHAESIKRHLDQFAVESRDAAAKPMTPPLDLANWDERSV